MVQQLWVYIREHDLQDPQNRRNIRCDKLLRSVFNADSINMFQMNKVLSKHIYPLPPGGNLFSSAWSYYIYLLDWYQDLTFAIVSCISVVLSFFSFDYEYYQLHVHKCIMWVTGGAFLPSCYWDILPIEMKSFGGSHNSQQNGLKNCRTNRNVTSFTWIMYRVSFLSSRNLSFWLCPNVTNYS